MLQNREFIAVGSRHWLIGLSYKIACGSEVGQPGSQGGSVQICLLGSACREESCTASWRGKLLRGLSRVALWPPRHCCTRAQQQWGAWTALTASCFLDAACEVGLDQAASPIFLLSAVPWVRPLSAGDVCWRELNLTRPDLSLIQHFNTELPLSGQLGSADLL